MIQSNEDLEGYLLRLERRFERAEDGTYLVSMGADRPLVALRVAAPLLVAQVDIGLAPVDSETAAPLFHKLLVLNATALVHAAYGIEGESIVLGAALELKNLDLNELEAVLADLDMALANQVPTLREVGSKKASA
ncbi:MAG TPA: CesT family type III secretion system chaperone [Polyangiaceae bacterium]|nr:CesT family type III secretion system chaperone [Polyangiaceae bacterium]